MSRKRDLVAEMAVRMSETAIGAAPNPNKRQCVAESSTSDIIARLESLDGQPYTDYTQAYLVDVTDELADETLAKQDV